MSALERHDRLERTHRDRAVAPDQASSHLRNENGETTAAAVVLVPLVLLMIFAVIQFAVGWHAKSALDAAAEDGLRAAQTNLYADPIEAAKASAQMNARFVENLTVSATPPAPGRLTITVKGTVPGPFPGTRWTIVARASGPLDRFRVQGQP